MKKFVRFYYDVPDENLTKILFRADSKYHDNNKYLILREEDNYYEVECLELESGIHRLSKSLEDHDYYVKSL